MPELPEVETTKRGIYKTLVNQTFTDAIIRTPKLRWPIPTDLKQQLCDKIIIDIKRRGKYLLIEFNHGTLIIHLGMSGYLRIVPTNTAAEKHDHIDLILNNQLCLRYNDTRRFGCFLWTTDANAHPLISSMGPEPLSNDFNASHLYQLSRNKQVTIKSFLMNSKVVVGVGNIYANESLFKAKINPKIPANVITQQQYADLVTTVKNTLKKAIEAGGTTLKDFQQTDGKPGYFQIQLAVYGKGGQPCPNCSHQLLEFKLQQRTTVCCPICQPE